MDGSVYFQIRSSSHKFYTTASGHVLKGETIEEAFRREINEEICLDIDSSDATLVDIVPWRMDKMKNGTFIKEIPERVILLSDALEVPTLDNLWNYLSHFYEKVTPARKEQFYFEDLAGIYTENGLSRLFAVCIRHAEIDGLKVLPKGK